MSQVHELEPATVEHPVGAQENPITLGKLMGDDLAKVKEWIGGTVKGRSQDTRLGWTRRFLWSLAKRTVEAEIDELMELPISDTLGQAYLKLREVQKHARSIEKEARKISKHASDTETRLKALLQGKPQTIDLKRKHLIGYEREHEWQVETNREVLGSLKFEGKFKLDLTGASLGIAGVSLEYVDPGDLTFSGIVTIELVPFPPPPKGSPTAVALEAAKALKPEPFKLEIKEKKFGIVEEAGAAMELVDSSLRFDRPIRLNPPIQILPESLIRQLQPTTEKAKDSPTSPQPGPPKGAEADSATGSANDEDSGR